MIVKGAVLPGDIDQQLRPSARTTGEGVDRCSPNRSGMRGRQIVACQPGDSLRHFSVTAVAC